MWGVLQGVEVQQGFLHRHEGSIGERQKRPSTKDEQAREVRAPEQRAQHQQPVVLRGAEAATTSTPVCHRGRVLHDLTP
eukprot:scaffold2020_cov188-Prasinococcus_capsulatus_cf.AAC.3